jgi:hypothetical protein
VLDGTAWAEFCESLALARNAILDENSPAIRSIVPKGCAICRASCAPRSRRSSRTATRWRPSCAANAHETIKMGADNPDNHYLSAPISGEHEYRIRGTRGTVYYLGFGAQEGGYGSTGSLKTTAYLDASDMKSRAGRPFRDRRVSAREQKGNWLADDARTARHRASERFSTYARERPAEMKIERIDGPHVPRPVTAIRHPTARLRSSAIVRGRLRAALQQLGLRVSRAREQAAAVRHRDRHRDGRNPGLRVLPQLLASRARRGAGHRSDAARVRLLELSSSTTIGWSPSTIATIASR